MVTCIKSPLPCWIRIVYHHIRTTNMYMYVHVKYLDITFIKQRILWLLDHGVHVVSKEVVWTIDNDHGRLCYLRSKPMGSAPKYPWFMPGRTFTSHHSAVEWGIELEICTIYRDKCPWFLIHRRWSAENTPSAQRIECTWNRELNA